MVSAPMILVSVLTLSFLITLTDSHFIHNFCESTKYPIKKSSNQSNLKFLFSSLIRNTPKTGFSTAIKGKPPNRVYGLAICIGDVGQHDCTSCLNKAYRNLLKLCRYPRGGIVWYDDCAIRYSRHNIFSSEYLLAGSASLDFFGRCQQQGPPNPDQFYKDLIYLVQSLSKIASFNKSARMFATGVNAQSDVTVQCTREISEQQCFNCLNHQFFYEYARHCGMSGDFVKQNCMVIHMPRNLFNSVPDWDAASPDYYQLAASPSYAIFSSFTMSSFSPLFLLALVSIFTIVFIRWFITSSVASSLFRRPKPETQN